MYHLDLESDQERLFREEGVINLRLRSKLNILRALIRHSWLLLITNLSLKITIYKYIIHKH